MGSFRVKQKAPEGKPTRFYSSRQEKSVAKAVNGRQTKNSGATALQKSDVLNDLFSIECKTKTKDSDSIIIKKEWFDKQVRESIQMGKEYSAIVFNFGPNEPYSDNHYIIDENLFLELLEHLERNR